MRKDKNFRCGKRPLRTGMLEAFQATRLGGVGLYLKDEKRVGYAGFAAVPAPSNPLNALLVSRMNERRREDAEHEPIANWNVYIWAHRSKFFDCLYLSLFIVILLRRNANPFAHLIQGRTVRLGLTALRQLRQP
jgi:hypothetical protein